MIGHVNWRVSLSEKYKAEFCVRICVRRTFQNVLNLAKIRKNYKKQSQANSDTSFSLRRLGSSEVMTSNPQVARSSRAGRAKRILVFVTKRCFTRLIKNAQVQGLRNSESGVATNKERLLRRRRGSEAARGVLVRTSQ